MKPDSKNLKPTISETVALILRSANETVIDSSLIAMVLKGLQDNYKAFVVII